MVEEQSLRAGTGGRPSGLKIEAPCGCCLVACAREVEVDLPKSLRMRNVSEIGIGEVTPRVK